VNELADVQEERVNIAKGGTKAPEFRAINPLGKVPYLLEADGFGTPESAAILRYLCATRSGQVADHWWPQEPRARARVDAAMDWYGSTLRVGSMVTVWNRAISLSMGFAGNDRLVQDYSLPALQAALGMLNNYWLSGRPYVAGQEVSIADLLLACEVEQLRLLDGAAQGPTFAALLEPHPAVRAWLQRVSQQCAPHYEDVHKVLHIARRRLVERAGGRGKL